MSGPALFLGFVVLLMIAARLFLCGETRTPLLPRDDATAGFRDPARPAQREDATDRHSG